MGLWVAVVYPYMALRSPYSDYFVDTGCGVVADRE